MWASSAGQGGGGWNVCASSSCAKTRRNRPQISSLDALGIRAESRVFRAAGLASRPLGCGWRATATGRTHGWLKSAVGRATGSELRTRKSLIRLDFIEHKSERSVMPQDTGVGRNVGLDHFASLRRVWEQTFGAAPPRSLSRVFMCRVLAYERQCRTHGGLSATTRRALLPWRTRHQVLVLPQDPFPPVPISSASGMAGPTRSRYSTTAIGSMAKPIRPSLPSQSESPAPTGQDHAFSV